jgi:pimeloyl-ACP methyl ester carboxylesterase
VAVAPIRDFVLLDEARAILEIVDWSASRVHLVGHSYGGAVAVRAAVERPHKIGSITLFEPTLFHLLEQTCPQDLRALSEVQHVANEVAMLNALGRPEDAAGIFVDYWAGSSVWAKLRLETRDTITRYVPKATLEFNALFNEPMRLQDYAKLAVPVFIMEGEFAPAPTHQIARRLLAALPRPFHAVIAGVGHMGPVTNSEQIATEIANFIARFEDFSGLSSRVAA